MTGISAMKKGYPLKPVQVLAMKNDWQSLNSKKITTKARRARSLFLRALRAFVVNKVFCPVLSA